ncbi:hypothetical protein C2G38_2207526 [Gigaspora rosea]|uniref:Uncharacterized protein n=1 Tax=Gigaspora rosea TaxID=44941 RepID=A0A397UI64_9GLOM|nr:hypothetical protein C2G38_2207526 [Gigaspora rosea]CAG8559276.1 12072_t:CDS:2 [Gigaspora rosea]
MKSLSNFSCLVLFIAIILSIAYVPPIIGAGHHVWVHNKLAPGTRARVDASDTLDFVMVIDEEESTAHKGFNLWIPENYTKFWLEFWVYETTKDAKYRGPYNNTQDYCWRFHGSEDFWDINTC